MRNEPRRHGPGHPRAPLGRGLAALAVLVVVAGACGPKRPAAIGPVPDPASAATGLERGTRLVEAIRIDFDWELNESGSRVRGRGVARAEPPDRARLDLFLDDGESVVSAALVGDELRLPYGARDDILPPVDLMWSTLGVFRPVPSARLVAGERLDNGAERLLYRQADGTELHYEMAGGGLRRVELLEGGDVLEWVRVDAGASRYPTEATYRNLTAFRELKIMRTGLSPAEPFDPRIWDPRE